MFDFYFGTPDEIDGDRERWLVTIKRMLPRWCNSIPDSEFLALHRLAAPSAGAAHVETGCGASTLALLEVAVRTEGVLYSWDTNSLKASYIRTVACETIGRHYGRDVNAHWKFVGYSSTDPDAGLSVLGELGAEVALCFLDSEHTWRTLGAEVAALCPLMMREAVVAIDDANYAYEHRNTAYVNMVRRKLGLGPVAESEGNVGEPFHARVEAALQAAFAEVHWIDDTYKHEYQSDLFWSYYASDREVMSGMGMEKTEALDHRFDAWRVVRA